MLCVTTIISDRGDSCVTFLCRFLAEDDPCMERMKFCLSEHIPFVSYGLIPAMSKMDIMMACECVNKR